VHVRARAHTYTHTGLKRAGGTRKQPCGYTDVLRVHNITRHFTYHGERAPIWTDGRTDGRTDTHAHATNSFQLWHRRFAAGRIADRFLSSASVGFIPNLVNHRVIIGYNPLDGGRRESPAISARARADCPCCVPMCCPCACVCARARARARVCVCVLIIRATNCAASRNRRRRVSSTIGPKRENVISSYRADEVTTR